MSRYWSENIRQKNNFEKAFRKYFASILLFFFNNMNVRNPQCIKRPNFINPFNLSSENTFSLQVSLNIFGYSFELYQQKEKNQTEKNYHTSTKVSLRMIKHKKQKYVNNLFQNNKSFTAILLNFHVQFSHIGQKKNQKSNKLG